MSCDQAMQFTRVEQINGALTEQKAEIMDWKSKDLESQTTNQKRGIWWQTHKFLNWTGNVHNAILGLKPKMEQQKEYQQRKILRNKENKRKLIEYSCK